ncbi:MAG: hypothetical protein HY691_15015 [Chloroflexi bacterium]|nr:hypothetical protein [Chloroflexota bacterium]
METVRATIEWTPEIDRFVLWAEDLVGSAFVPEPIGDDPLASLLLEVDEDERETGRVVGVEMAILEFDRWGDLPTLDRPWQLRGWEPLPLDALLKRVQRELRQRQRRLKAAQRGVSAPEG